MMIEPKRSRALILIIVFLLLANIGLVVLMMMDKPQKGKQKNRKDHIASYLKKELGYNDAQMARYDSIHTAHQKHLQPDFDSMRREKQSRFRFLSANGFSDSAIRIAGGMMAKHQEDLEIKMLQHLRDIRNIGDASQQAKFDSTFFRQLSLKRKEGMKKER